MSYSSDSALAKSKHLRLSTIGGSPSSIVSHSR